MQSMTTPMRSQVLWGTMALAVVTIIGLVVAVVYISPPRQQFVTFYTQDAQSVHPGDTVRVAGIVVGKVKDLAIEPDRVLVRASVDQTAFVGDQSQVEVRMLTVVGGYYVTIISLGDSPLGTRAIPVERVTMPYSLIRTLSDATTITEHVATKPIRESIDELQHGLADGNVDAATKLINAGNSITDMMDKQRGQLSSILELSNEYIASLNDNRDLLEYLLSRVAILEETLMLYSKGFGQAIAGLGEVGRRLESVAEFYMPHRSEFLDRVRGVLREFRTIADRNGLLVRVLNRMRDRMEHALDAQNSSAPPELFATDLCIPMEGSPC
ncbi:MULTISPECIES: MlaD family protein [unclassified Mycobacterium]|uniref:MlaD family protein n=1 Tax=unclassified Mycobacterium TaxID=2642494 RepID=UPI0029C7532F|nr:MULTISPECIES: MlaD family protein [unclassified Mycobacterium]